MVARSEHACDTHPLFTSPTSFRQVRAVTFQHAAVSPQRVVGFAPCTPIVVNNKTCRASMICVTILRYFFSSILQVDAPKNARQRAPPRAEAGRSRTTTRKRYPLAAFGHSFGRTA